MPAEKLSISLESELAEAVRAAAADDGVSVSTWLAKAAEARARQRNLRIALDAHADEVGALDEAEIDRLVADARRNSRMTAPRASRS
ncbi:MAG: hypothetical protein ACRDZN_03845 [Acidimicrobiales bacterium]